MHYKVFVTVGNCERNLFEKVFGDGFWKPFPHTNVAEKISTGTQLHHKAQVTLCFEWIIEFHKISMWCEMLQILHLLSHFPLTVNLLVQILLSKTLHCDKVTGEFVLCDTNDSKSSLSQSISKSVELMSCDNWLSLLLDLLHNHCDQILLVFEERIIRFTRHFLLVVIVLCAEVCNLRLLIIWLKITQFDWLCDTSLNIFFIERSSRNIFNSILIIWLLFLHLQFNLTIKEVLRLLFISWSVPVILNYKGSFILRRRERTERRSSIALLFLRVKVDTKIADFAIFFLSFSLLLINFWRVFLLNCIRILETLRFKIRDKLARFALCTRKLLIWRHWGRNEFFMAIFFINLGPPFFLDIFIKSLYNVRLTRFWLPYNLFARPLWRPVSLLVWQNFVPSLYSLLFFERATNWLEIGLQSNLGATQNLFVLIFGRNNNSIFLQFFFLYNFYTTLSCLSSARNLVGSHVWAHILDSSGVNSDLGSTNLNIFHWIWGLFLPHWRIKVLTFATHRSCIW